MDPRNGQILTVPGTANTQAAIGTPIPGSGNPLNGIRQAGDGIAKTGYTWPAIVVGPRFGVAYDISGNQMTVLRAGGGLFYDRPDGNTVFSIPGNPPIANSADLRNGMLQTLDPGPQHPAEPAAGDVPVRGEGAGDSGSGKRACSARCRGPWPSTCRMSATTASTGWARFRVARPST